MKKQKFPGIDFLQLGKDHIKVVAITASVLVQRRKHYLGMGFHEYISKPFKEEEVFNCLNELLDVEFLYEPDETEQSSTESLDLSQVIILEDLHDKLTNSAKLHAVTELEKYLRELSQNNEASEQLAVQLAEHLAGLLKTYKMDTILKILKSVPKAKN